MRKNNGAQWQAKGESREVSVYDFLSLADGKAIPYGVYDLVHNRGFVTVGIDYDTAELLLRASEGGGSSGGKSALSRKVRASDQGWCGSSNGYYLWKRKENCKNLPMKNNIAVSVVHYPPA